MPPKKKKTNKKITKKKSRKGVGGRPRFKIDFAQVEKLAGIQCTQEEIASFLGCSVDTLQRSEEFCGLYKKGMDVGRMSLRRKQWKAAEGGNNTMLVWLGKQYLGQKDKNETEITGKNGGPIVTKTLMVEGVSPTSTDT